MGCLNSQPKVEKHFPNSLPEERRQSNRPNEERAPEINLAPKQQPMVQKLQSVEQKQVEMKEIFLSEIEVLAEQPISSLITDYLWQWDTAAPNAHCFRINEGKSQLLTKDDKYYQIVSQPLPDKGSVAATLMIEYGDDSKSGIIVGIITQTRKNEQFSRGWNEETVAYATWINGKVGWVSSSGVGYKIENRSNLFIPHGELLSLTVDIEKQKIYFSNFVNDQKIVIKMPPSFQGKHLYLFATMTCFGDSVSFL